MNNKFETIIEGMLADNYAICEDFFAENLIAGLRNNLLDDHAEHRMHPAGIGRQATSQQNTAVRGDVISWMDERSEEPHEQAFFAAIEVFYRYLNLTCFTGIDGSEFHYALYKPGSFYKRHLDQFKHNSGRQFSMITYLSEDWLDTDGGELVLYAGAGETIIRVKTGRTVFFKADEIEHEVKPASRNRMSIAGWLLNLQA